MSIAEWRKFLLVGGGCLWLGTGWSQTLDGANTNATGTPAAPATEHATVSNDDVRASLQLQEQMHAAQLAVERSRQESEAAAAIAARLESLEQSLATQRRGELEAAQSTTRLMLVVLGVFATVGFVSVVLTAYYQWRTVSRLTESPSTAAARQTAALPTVAAFPGGAAQLADAPVEKANVRLLGAIEKLERRILELEHAAAPALPAAPGLVESGKPNGVNLLAPEPAKTPASPATGRAAQIEDLFEKGRSQLALDRAEDAIALFDGVLALDAKHAEALVKKGSALEKLRRFPEALECYNLAIAADNSMTMAHLCKGGLCNRLERFSEAVECYELALRTQEKKRGA